MEWGNVAQWAAVGTTTAAIVVALLKEELIRLWRRPKLTMEIAAKHPFIVRTPVRHAEWNGWRYFIRLRIRNTGRERAEKVKVFLTEALIRENDTYRPMPNFTPMNLRWSYTDIQRPVIYLDGISPGMERFCDFGAISDPKHPNLQPLSTTRLALRQEILSHNREWLRQGQYKFELRVAGSNYEPKAYCLHLHLTGLWDDDLTTMMSNGLMLDISR
jgi:hypothetical protein